MPVYEIAANLLIFVLLWKLRNHKWGDGTLFLVYLTLYSLERFFLAFTSSYRIIALGLTQSQMIALVGRAAAGAILAWRARAVSRQAM